MLTDGSVDNSALARRIAQEVQSELDAHGGGWISGLFGRFLLMDVIFDVMEERPRFVPASAVLRAQKQIAKDSVPSNDHEAPVDSYTDTQLDEQLDQRKCDVASLLVQSLERALRKRRLSWVVRGSREALWNFIRPRLEWDYKAVLVEVILATDTESMRELQPMFDQLPAHILREILQQLAEVPNRAMVGRNLIEEVISRRVKLDERWLDDPTYRGPRIRFRGAN